MIQRTSHFTARRTPNRHYAKCGMQITKTCFRCTKAAAQPNPLSAHGPFHRCTHTSQTMPAAALSASCGQRQNTHPASFRFLLAAVPMRIYDNDMSSIREYLYQRKARMPGFYCPTRRLIPLDSLILYRHIFKNVNLNVEFF